MKVKTQDQYNARMKRQRIKSVKGANRFTAVEHRLFGIPPKDDPKSRACTAASLASTCERAWTVHYHMNDAGVIAAVPRERTCWCHRGEVPTGVSVVVRSPMVVAGRKYRVNVDAPISRKV